MKYSVFTASTPDWSPEEAAQILAAQGWDGIEWRIVDQKRAAQPGFWAGNRATWPLTRLESSLDEISRITAAAGLGFSALGAYAECGERDDVERLLAATRRLGAGQVRISPPILGTSTMGGAAPSGRTYPDLFAESKDQFAWVAERAAAHGVKALVELHPETLTASASSALRLLEGLDPKHVGVIHDVGNLVVEGHEDYLAGLQMLGDYLALVHVKNARWLPTADGGVGALASVRWASENAPLRAGQANILDYFQALELVGYRGWVTVEDFSTEVPLIQRTAENLAYLKDVESAVAAERANVGRK